MGKFVQKLFREIASTLAEIKAGDVMGLYAAIYAIIFVGAFGIIFPQNKGAGIVILLFSPIPILILTILTNIGVNKIKEVLESSSEQSETDANIEVIEYPQSEGKEPHASLWVINHEKVDIARCYARLVSLVFVDNDRSETNITNTVNPNNFPLSWGGGKGKKGFIMIARNEGKEVLNIAKIANDLITILFDGHEDSNNRLGIYKFEIEIHGDLGTNSISAIHKKGYFQSIIGNMAFSNNARIKSESHIDPSSTESVKTFLGVKLEEITDERTKKEAAQKPKLRYSLFRERAIHLEWKLNADAEIVYRYLLQRYVGILHFHETDKNRYEIDRLESFNPKQHDVFQYGLIAHGKKVTFKHKLYKVGFMEMRADSVIEPIEEMFFITISQGKKDVSILSFDTDVRDTSQFTVGLVRELHKAFNVEMIH